MEVVEDMSYARDFAPIEAGPNATPAWLRVSAWPHREHALKLELHGAQPTRMLQIINRLRRKEEAKPAAPAAPPRQEVLLEEIRDLLKKRA